jgi:hypothetical protein
LAGFLLDGLDDTVGSSVEEEWTQENTRRIAELDSGNVKPALWPEARRQVTAFLCSQADPPAKVIPLSHASGDFHRREMFIRHISVAIAQAKLQGNTRPSPSLGEFSRSLKKSGSLVSGTPEPGCGPCSYALAAIRVTCHLILKDLRGPRGNQHRAKLFISNILPVTHLDTIF